ncbi:hypothetical protein E6C60_1386 [Paenibacillus algicola]|uniref:Uncharacterized protein n=1 Tax=Paenibacillus algicola TaxID=2565926 RepID=A0A4P8XHS6_9BACL|nr:hypothetical protein E6C60_1386 [Paenibacillus algicola]
MMILGHYNPSLEKAAIELSFHFSGMNQTALSISVAFGE